MKMNNENIRKMFSVILRRERSLQKKNLSDEAFCRSLHGKPSFEKLIEDRKGNRDTGPRTEDTAVTSDTIRGRQ